MKIAAGILLAALTLISQPASADFRAGLEALEAGDAVRAAELWKTAAEGGDPAAQRNLGLLYLQGRGVPRDPARAADWFRRAADQSFAPAAANLASLYLRGQGVERDPAKAFEYLRIAADGGLAEAQHNLGVLYEHGVGVRADEDAAVFWYSRAFEGGFAAAGERLAGLRPEAALAAETAEVAAETPETREPEIAAPAGDGLVDRLVTLFSPAGR
jgi:hypothetical protein